MIMKILNSHALHEYIEPVVVGCAAPSSCVEEAVPGGLAED